VAEAAIEYSQQDINIAFVNELPKFSTLIDTQAVLEAAGINGPFLPLNRTLWA
jgi:UDP-N-acetyl-D-mannosaminuronate dehydrogenase